MSWRDDYQPGSFRSAAFRTQGHERAGGRRVVSFEFPGRDEPLVEDLGRRARQFSIDCHVIGADYRAARDLLIEALEARGPGLLVHPWHGQMMVVVLDYTTSESTEDGGVCWFKVTFAEAGQAVPATLTPAFGQLSGNEADKAIADAPGRLLQMFSIEDAASFVEQSASDIISGIATVSEVAAGLQGGVGPVLRAFQTGLKLLPGNVSSLLRAPLSLGLSIVGLVAAVAALNGTARRKNAALSLMLDWEPRASGFPDITANRRRETANRAALLATFRVPVAAELARSVGTMTFASYEEAAAVREALTTRLDSLALAAADAGDDDTAAVFDALRRAAARDIAARGQSLARVYAVQLQAREPTLVVANRVYGTAGIADRADEIAARNRISHPGFLPADMAIQLLTSQSGERAA